MHSRSSLVNACLLGALLLSRVGVDADYVTVLLPGVLVFGLGLSLTVAPLTSAALSSVEDAFSGVAAGVNNAVARSSQAAERINAVALLLAAAVAFFVLPKGTDMRRE